MQRIAFVILFFAFSFLRMSASNPAISNYLTNLSGAVNLEALDDKMPEMVISGNTIHVVWIEYKYGADNNFYYCRSTDLGKTWEKPQLLAKLKDSEYARQPVTRKLAVDGTNIHICFPDYSYYENGTGRIYYLRSTNGGSSFETVKELVTSVGAKMSGSHIKAVNGKVAVAYFGSGSKNGLRMLYSASGGTSFTEKLITEEAYALSDFWYDGTQMIVVSESYYYYYGLNWGKVFVSISNDNAATFTTQKVSLSYNESPTVVKEICRCYHDSHYAPKVAKSGNFIHVLFLGNNEKGVWTTLYARSTDNGATFQKAVDINNGVNPSIQGGQETVAAKNGNVCLASLSVAGKVYLTQSSDNGATLSAARNIMSDGFAYIETIWWISLLTDPNDNTGKTIYVTGRYMESLKSADGGKTFGSATLASPFLGNSVSYIMADMAIDSKGQKHWICEGKWNKGTDSDIFYRKLGNESDPGSIDKALKIITQNNPGLYDAALVPSSQSLNFDSAMTAEAWVKLIPVTDNGSVNILAKVNGSDNYDYTPSGFNMGFRYNSGKFCFNSGVSTDKGGFVNWVDCNINDTLWHHVAFTYDARAGLNNFISYVDGLLATKQTVTGSIIKGDGLLFLGQRSAFMGNNSKYYIDNVRLWNKALTQNELLENQQKKTFTGDSRLKLNLTFDDTFKDISGNGNDAIPLFAEQLVKSDFNPPVPSFEFFRVMNEVSFNNNTVNATSYRWSFGNSTTSTLGNPKCTYSTAGEYPVTLVAANNNSVAAAIGNVTIGGLSKIEPVQAGNSGYCNLLIYGGGLKVSGTSIVLRKTGNADITGEDIFSPATGVLSTQMKLEVAALGKWNVVVTNGTNVLTLNNAFEVVKAEAADPWVSISGRGAIIFNRWQPYTLSFGNNGNVDAHSVPVWFAITDDDNLEIEFIDFNLVVSDLAVQKGIESTIKGLGTYFKTDVVLGENMKARVYSFMIPNIPAKSSGNVHIRIKTSKSILMKVWANPPWVEATPAGKSANLTGASSQAKLMTAECVAGVIAEGVVDIGTSAIPGVGCVWSAGKWGYQTGTTPPWNKKGSWMSTLWNACVTVVDCGINLSGIGAVYKGLGVFMANMAGYVKSYKECLELLKTNSAQNMGVNAVYSFDPNEITGPKGYGNENWIQKNSLIPYSIMFENKSTATAPAHLVTVSDTLDLTKFNLHDFSFTSFGWGDTIKTPPGKFLKEFSVDVDLRPGKNLITRISGKLDTLKGIVNWEFLSLDPATLQLEDDPMLGFLPPNNPSNAGEGFVSYSVGLKPELKTNSQIKNRASIVFDANKSILTNQFLNTLDMDNPQSQVLPLDATIDSRFPVTWSGSDIGSGINCYSVYVMENDTSLTTWLLNTKLTTSEFEGKVGSKYKFYSLATDNVSLYEKATGLYDAQTTVTVHAEEFELVKDELSVYPNPAKESLKIQLRNAPCGVYVVELIGINGNIQHSEIYPDYSLQQGITLNLNGCNPGNYIVRVVYGNKNVVRKIVIH